jgi:hypothetical protein
MGIHCLHLQAEMTEGDHYQEVVKFKDSATILALLVLIHECSLVSSIIM